jgi:predicted XRE-type DNA-binding protein
MSTGYVFPVDPSDLARFSYEDPRFDDEDEDLEREELEDEQSLASYIPDGDYESRIAPLLDRIPDREADLIYLYFIEKKRQADIATIFGVTQAAISYRLDRGIQRLKFLLSIPQMTEEELRADLPEIFPTRLDCPNCEHAAGNCLICLGSKQILVDVEILVGMWMTTCQSEVASKLGLTQGRVRHRFFKAVETLEDMARIQEKYLPYQQIFSAVAGKKFNILREVRLPQWADRGGDECT